MLPYNPLKLRCTDPFLGYVPTAGISLENGTALASQLSDSQTLIADLDVDAFANNVTTNNVLATTIGGDQDNVYQLGGHTDSVVGSLLVLWLFFFFC